MRIETGYMRRIPILATDDLMEYVHPITERRIMIRTPRKESLFANKYCTMFSRKSISGRDVFDVLSISKTGFDRALFLDVVMIESLLMGIDVTEPLLDRVDMAFLNVQVKDLVSTDIDWNEVIEGVVSFVGSIKNELESRDYRSFLETFVNEEVFDLAVIENRGRIHDDIITHPQLLWQIERKRSEH